MKLLIKRRGGFKRVVLVVVALLVALTYLLFILENQQEVTLSFAVWSTPPLPASVFVTVSLLVGMIVGPLCGVLLGRKSVAG
ncbi:lipopolysaccharide assembly protein LapA domain-containing protein [Pseudomonas sp. NFIX28]|uniref:lipopolysaccharide assembly protein LapA domain-containing protein n=1 Tax=Pseudomonas sp. NFIX28 TaxID=1566235 RepID=UPI000B87FD10|nr:lipopolysaccharide assembly protein LapA domain-containing protein [Pseudomonas sp. NFIX28]